MQRRGSPWAYLFFVIGGLYAKVGHPSDNGLLPPRDNRTSGHRFAVDHLCRQPMIRPRAPATTNKTLCGYGPTYGVHRTPPAATLVGDSTGGRIRTIASRRHSPPRDRHPVGCQKRLKYARLAPALVEFRAARCGITPLPRDIAAKQHNEDPLVIRSPFITLCHGKRVDR